MCLQHWLAEENGGNPSVLLHIQWFCSHALVLYICETSHACHGAQIRKGVLQEYQKQSRKTYVPMKCEVKTLPSCCCDGTSLDKQRWSAHTMNWLLRIHLLLVKTEHAAETRILLKLSHCFDSWLPGWGSILSLDFCNICNSLKLSWHQLSWNLLLS